MRLAKYLASCGIGSRRLCETLIMQGLIKINNEIVTKPAININPSIDRVYFKDLLMKPKELVYYLLYKPTGYTATRKDHYAERLVTELVPNDPPVWPVGRLDVDTSGLIIMTNDGDLTQLMTHPKHQKEKEYILKTNVGLSLEEVESIKNGTKLEDGLIKPDIFEKLDDRKYRIVLHEGKKRIIRRIIAHYHKRILLLERIRIEEFRIDNLHVGQYRILSKTEIMKVLNDI